MYRDFQFLTHKILTSQASPDRKCSVRRHPVPLSFSLPVPVGHGRPAAVPSSASPSLSAPLPLSLTHSLHFRRFFCSLFVRSFAVSFAAFVLRCCPLCHALIVLVKRKSPKWRRTNNWADEDGRQAGSREGTDDTPTLTFCRLVGDGERKEIVTRQNCLCEQVVHGSLPPSGNVVIP